MKKHLIASFMLILFSSAFMYAQQKVTFQYEPLKAGMNVTFESSLEMKMTLQVDMGGQTQEFEMGNKKSDERKVRYLEITNDVPSKLNVVYTKYEELDQSPMGSKTKPERPVIGRNYSIERSDSNIVIISRDTLTISKNEESFLKNEYHKKDFDGKFRKVISGKTFVVGEKVSIAKELAQSIFDEMKNANDVKEFNLILKEVRSVQNIECGIFDMNVIIAGSQKNVNLNFALSGELVVGIKNSLPLSMSVKGPIEVQGIDGEIPITGSGTMEGMQKAVYVFN